MRELPLAAVGCLVVLLCCAAARAEVVQSPYIYASRTGSTIVSLKFDGAGQSNYGMDTIAAGGGLRNVASMSLSGSRMLRIVPVSGQLLEWDLPFVRAGYYDPDTHRNYPDEHTTAGWTSLTLPFVRFTGASGQYTRIENFKRLPLGVYYNYLNVDSVNIGLPGKLLMHGDSTQNWDLDTKWTNSTTVLYDVQDDRLTLKPSSYGTLTIEVVPRGTREAPSNSFLLPSVTFTPDATVTYEPTGKSVSWNALLTDFIRMGIFWHPENYATGEWVTGADRHLLDDPRTWYVNDLRLNLLRGQQYIGYDRFGHFGYQYAWNNYPDYGAGPNGLLNNSLSSLRAPWDMRMLHINGIRISKLVEYVLATDDLSFLKSRRARVVKTDGAESQPICGSGYNSCDIVLSAGDYRLDGAPATTQSTLGQSFTASAPFTTVSAYLANPEWRSSAQLGFDNTARGKIRLYQSFGGPLIAQSSFSIPPNTSTYVDLSIGYTVPAGQYYLEISDDVSGVQYYGPGVCWWTEVESNYSGGNAYTCGRYGDVEAQLNWLFDYMRNYMGAAANNIAYYQNDPQYNIPNHHSGRHAVGTQTSYWETTGGGYDSFVALWYNEACASMAKLYDFLGDTAKANSFRNLKTLADQKYRSVFWHSVTENGRAFSRFFACKDWDGVVHDYGHTMYNIEAASRDIATPEQVRQILWWLDRGQYSPNGGSSWSDYIYSIWGAAPPFNTIEMSSWQNVTGILPYLQVVTNGGARLTMTARDLITRSRYLSVDNMHERNARVLARFASPDRLTGGRTFADIRGRWHFLDPESDRADFEGFREIFPQDGVVATSEPLAYLGAEWTGTGLKLRPRVPSDFTSYVFSNIGYRRTVFNFKAEAQRSTSISVADDGSRAALATGAEYGQTFTASANFNKVGLHVSVAPFNTKRDNQLTISLHKPGAAGWELVSRNWYSHVQDGQWVWVSANQILPAGSYFVTVTDARAAAGETISLLYNSNDVLPNGCRTYGGVGQSGDYAIQVVDEKTALTIDTVYNPSAKKFALSGTRSGTTVTDLGGGQTRFATVLDPDESALLGPARSLWWEFYNFGNTEGWTAGSGISGFGVSNGSLIGDIVGSDPYITGPSDLIDANLYHYVHIRMKLYGTTGPGTISWLTPEQPAYSSERQVSFDLITDGEFHDYWVRMSANPNWAGAAKSLRIGLGHGPSGHFEIDFIRLLKPAGVTGKVADVAGRGMVGARVESVRTGEYTTSGTDGTFVLSDLAPVVDTIICSTEDANDQATVQLMEGSVVTQNFTLVAPGTTYHVKPDGNDALDGLTYATAWKTWNRGGQLAVLKPGDTVLIEPGTYTVPSGLDYIGLITNSVGAPGYPIVFKANGPGVVLEGNGGNNAVVLYPSNRYLQFEGFRVQNFLRGFWVLCNDVTIKNCSFSSSVPYGSGVLADYQFLTGLMEGITVEKCLFYNSVPQSGYYNCVRTHGSTDGLKVFNNTFDNVHTAIVLIDWGLTGIPGNYNYQIKNNITSNSRGALEIYGESTGARQYNLYYNLTNGYPSPGVGEIFGQNPLYVGGGNYNLRSGSPAIDAGTNVGLTYAGTAPDMGAYETDYKTCASIQDIKVLPNGTWVNVVQPKLASVASTVFDDGSFYVQEADRSSGIKLKPIAPGLPAVAEGDRVVFSGELRSGGSGERYVGAASLAVVSP